MVGATRNARAVAEFELLYHEIGSITTLLNFLTANNQMNHIECHLQHVLSTYNRNVAKLLEFLLERQTQYSVIANVSVPLHNLLTKQDVNKKVAVHLLKCVEHGECASRSYRQKRLIEKSKKINVTIPKDKLPDFTDQPENTQSTIRKEKQNLSSIDAAKSQRNMDIANERGWTSADSISRCTANISTVWRRPSLSHQ